MIKDKKKFKIHEKIKKETVTVCSDIVEDYFNRMKKR